jgi:hypothetical protein
MQTVFAPYNEFVNHGKVDAMTASIWSRYFENSGTNVNLTPAYIAAHAGPLSVDTLNGIVTNSQLAASGDVLLNADRLLVRRTTLTAGTNFGPALYLPGMLRVWPTNFFGDGGTNADNYWTNTAGVQIYRRPPTGDLLGTRITSYARDRAQVDEIWPGQNRGPVVAGYSNNLALGRLVLDGPGALNVFAFHGPDSSQQYALYVDYLDLRNDVTNYNRTLQLADNFTIYFADSSVPPLKLATHYSGRVRWMSAYTGLFSSTNITYIVTNAYGVVTNTYTLNTGLVRSKDLDSDFDFLVNSEDPEPVFQSANVDLFVTQTQAGSPPVPQVALTWWALAFSVNYVDYATNVTSPTWRELTSFVNGMPFTQRVTIMDTTGGKSLRVYRVREVPQ